MAAQNGHLEVAMLLLDKGADVNMADEVNYALKFALPEPSRRGPCVSVCVCVYLCVCARACARVRARVSIPTH